MEFVITVIVFWMLTLASIVVYKLTVPVLKYIWSVIND